MLREALSNVARHASASAVKVRIDVSNRVQLVVRDDGVGIATAPVRRSGLVNLHGRAEARCTAAVE